MVILSLPGRGRHGRGAVGWPVGPALDAAPTGGQIPLIPTALTRTRMDIRFPLRDRHEKFTLAFDEVLRSEGVEVIRLPVQFPVANSFAERWVGTARRECLDHLLILGRRHLEYVLSQFVEHYQEARPHQGLGQRTPSGASAAGAGGRIGRRDRLGGLIHEYERAAA
jgi:putative transposase